MPATTSSSSSAPLLQRLSDVWDADFGDAIEETSDKKYARATANDRYVIPDGAHWNEVRGVAKDVGALSRGTPRHRGRESGPIRRDLRRRLVDQQGAAADATLKNLLEHFLSRSLSVASVPEDELGNGYEYLIKRFADDSGHTAQEFYTNRTVVHLMVRMLEPKPGESIYDPTCGTVAC